MKPIPSLFAAPDVLRRRYQDFLARKIRNPHTRRAYSAAAQTLSNWCEPRGISEVSRLDARLLNEFIDDCGDQSSPATVRQRIACLRRLFRWLNDFGFTVPDLFRALRMEYVPRESRARVALDDRALGRLIASCGGSALKDQRDRALIAVLAQFFIPIQGICRLRVRDFSRDATGAWLRLGRGDDRGLFRVPPEIAKFLDDYIRAAGLARRESGWLFRSIAGVSGAITDRALSQPDVYRIVCSRAMTIGIEGQIGPREVRSSGLARFMKVSGNLEIARRLAEHKTTKSTIRYAPPGIQRPRNRIARRLPDSAPELDDYEW